MNRNGPGLGELGQSPAEFTAAKNEYSNLVVGAPGRLSPWAKYFQKIILARDYDTLFSVLPLEYWQPGWQLGKYSFRDVERKVYQISQRFLPGGGTPTITTVREYVPFSEASIKRFVYGPYYQVNQAHNEGVCPTDQLDAGFAHYWGKTKAAAEGNRVTDRAHIFPIAPGNYLCDLPEKSLWVKIRSKVYIAVAVVAAIYLGPIVLEKVGALIPGSAPAGAAAVVIQYVGEYNLLLVADEPGQITARAAIEGGTGIWEKIDDEPAITDVDAARDSAIAKLDKFAVIGDSLTFDTIEAGFAPGQFATVSWLDLGDMLIESVEISEISADKPTYHITALTGPAMGDWTRFFRRLDSQKDEILDRLTIGRNELVIIVVREGADWDWTETVTENVFACAVPSATLFPSGTLFPC